MTSSPPHLSEPSLPAVTNQHRSGLSYRRDANERKERWRQTVVLVNILLGRLALPTRITPIPRRTPKRGWRFYEVDETHEEKKESEKSFQFIVVRNQPNCLVWLVWHLGSICHRKVSLTLSCSCRVSQTHCKRKVNMHHQSLTTFSPDVLNLRNATRPIQSCLSLSVSKLSSHYFLYRAQIFHADSRQASSDIHQMMITYQKIGRAHV